jgi:hypothetical protein
MRNRWRVLAAAVVPVLGLAGMMLTAPAASAATDYTIVGLNAESLQGTQTSCTSGGDASCEVAYTTGSPRTFVLINEGSTDCDGGTCWHIQDTFSKLCLDWASPEEPGSGFIIELTCSGGLGNVDEDFNNPPTNGAFGGWYNRGATENGNDGNLWGVVWDSATDFLVVEPHPIQSHPDAKWAMNT